MARTLVTLVMLRLLTTFVAGQDAIPPSLQAMADTERAFARTATVEGVRDAFLEFFADDSIAFDPAPTLAKARLLKQESRPFSVAELLWEPRTGDVAASGELGWLTGPSTFINHSGPDTSPHYGNYLSVWRKQPSGQWRVFIDVGIPTPAPVPFAPGFTRAPFFRRYARGEDKETAGKALLAADRQLNADTGAHGGAAAYRGRLTEGSRLHRAGVMPMTEIATIVQWLDKEGNGFTATSGAAEAANAGDLGYSYGTYETKGAKPESGAYVRIWTRDDQGRWFVMADVTQNTSRRQ